MSFAALFIALAPTVVGAGPCETAWGEQVGSTGLWTAERCGDANGVERSNTCDDYASLRWHMAQSVGALADAAYEDAYAACNAGESR